MPERPPNAPPIPLSRLEELAAWRLRIRCGVCRRSVMISCADLADRHGRKLPVWKLVARLRCQSPNRPGRTCGGKPDLVTLVLGRERRKDFLVYQEITVLDDRMRIND